MNTFTTKEEMERGVVEEADAKEVAPQSLIEQMVDVLGCIDRIYRTLGYHDVQSLQDELANRLGGGACATLEATILAAKTAAQLAKEELLALNRMIEGACQNAGRVQYAKGAPEKAHSQMSGALKQALMAETKENIVNALKRQSIS